MSSRPGTLLRFTALVLAGLLLSGCNLVVLSPSGDIAARQGQLIMIATALMLLVIVPVIALTFFFAWRYRASNTQATYKPNWDHSTQLELVIWAVPLLIIIALGAVTWISTHLLDPYRPLDRISAGRPVSADVQPLEIQVTALDWKWLFIYPEYGVASVNQMAAPVDRPIRFRITASSTMNAFYIPELAGMIYAMPGMETKLHAVINHEGSYQGFSSNFSGAGFSHMRFQFHGLSNAGFDAWIAKARAADQDLTRAKYLELEVPSQRVAASLLANVEDGLFDAIVNRCVDMDRLCMNQMMAYDAAGGLGLDTVDALAMPRHGDLRNGPFVAAEVCTVEQPAGTPNLVAAAGAMTSP